MSREYGSCAMARTHLNAFADGELRGATLREVSAHVESCTACSTSVGEIASLGDMLRGAVASQTFHEEAPDLAGLADGVVSRIRAEDHESWRGILERATDDLHWVMVGVGSVAAALISVLIVSAVVQSGVGQRGDSLAAMLNTLAAPPPELGRSTGMPGDLAALGIADVQLASLAEVSHDGRVLHLKVLSNMDPRDAAVLFAELRGMKFVQQEDRRMTDPTGRQIVLLFSSTEVRGKIL